MPQAGYTPIQIYSSSTPTNAPSAGNLTNDTKGSELAINIADKNLFFKDSTNAVNTVPIRQSGAASDGWLSSTDWNTFNNKQPAGAYLTSVTADSPLSGAGTSASHLVIAQATTSTSGYLSSTDWNTFNGKQAALVSGTNIKTVGGVSLLGSGDVGTIGVGYGGTGQTSFTAGRILFGNGSSAINSSANLFWDNANAALGIGTSTPALPLEIAASYSGGIGARITNTSQTNQYLSVLMSGNSTAVAGYDNSGVIEAVATGVGSGTRGLALSAYVGPVMIMSGGRSEVARFFPSGGVSIGNTTDPGATNLSVTGNAGFGVTPFAWGSINKVIDIGNANQGQISVTGRTDGANGGSIAQNSYRDSANTWRYKYNGYAQLFDLYSGAYYWSTAASGAAGNAITWSTPMTLHASGGLSLGNATDPGATNLSVTGSITTGGSLSLPNAKVTSANTGSIAVSGSLVITFAPIVSGILSYELELVGAGNNNTRAVYFISSRYGSVNATSLSSATQGLGASHTVTAGSDGSSNLTITIANTNASFAETGVWSFNGVYSS